MDRKKSDKKNAVSTCSATSSNGDDLKQPTMHEEGASQQKIPVTYQISNGRFAECVIAAQLSVMAKPLIPKKNTGWSIHNFSFWRNKRSLDE